MLCEISHQNSSAARLEAGGDFEGAAHFSLLPDIMVTLKTDVAGTLYVDFSVNEGRGWDTTLTFDVAAGGGEFHTAVKGPRSCRVRYVNGDEAQTYFRMQTSFGLYRQANSPLKSPVQQDADAATVRTIDPFLTITQGLFQGYSTDTKFGRNPSVDSTGEDIWNGGGTYTGFPVGGSAETIEVISSSSDDVATSGSGAWTVRLFGLDANWDPQTEDIALNGQNYVPTTKTWRRMYRMRVLTAGAGGANAGTLTARHTSTTANVFSVMPVGSNRTAIAAWTVPAGHTAYVKRVHFAGARANGTVLADCTFRVREFGGAFEARRLFTIGNGLVVNQTYVGGMVLPEKTDIKARVESASANSGDFAAEFEYVLVKN